MVKQQTSKRYPTYLRDIIATTLWAYALVKLFVFDVDRYLLSLIVPNSMWILNLRLFAILLVLAVLWVILGNKRFLLSFAYVIGYPLVILFWKLPIFIFHRWALFLVLLPLIYDAFLSFRTTFVLYTAISVSTLAIILGKAPIILVPAMVCLGLSLIFILYRAFVRTHSSRIYSLMAAYIRGLHPKIASGEFDQPLSVTNVSIPKPENTQSQPPSAPDFPQLYLHYVLYDFVAHNVDQVSRERKYNAILQFSLLNIILGTIIIFALLNWSLFKLSTLSFSGIEGVGFLQFLPYSIGHLIPADLTVIHPTSSAAITLASLEVLVGVFIIVIGAFSLFTVWRDTFREDFSELLEAIHKTIELVDERIKINYSVSSSELELSVALKSGGVVNLLRRFRGLPEIDTAQAQSNVSEHQDN